MANDRKLYDTAALLASCEGRWRDIFSALIRNQAFTMAMEANGRKSGPCPINGGTTKFRLFKDWEIKGGGISNDEDPRSLTNGISMIMWVNGQEFRTVCKNIEDYLGGNYRQKEMSDADRADLERRRRQSAERNRKEQAEKDEQNRARLNKVWQETLPANHPDAAPLREYFVRRGLDAFGIPETIRYHPALPYVENEEVNVGTFPAMISLVQDVEGTPVTLHRTYLTEDGRKAPVSEAKKLMSYVKLERDMRGTGIRLGKKTGRILHVAEGIETLLAVTNAINEDSAIAAISSVNMASLVVPPQTEVVVIWADHDRPNPKTGTRAGIDAAERLRAMLESIGLKAFVLLPQREIPNDKKGIDWNDILLSEGARSIRRIYEKLRIEF